MREPALDLSPSPGDSVRHTTCYMCACRCGIKVWLRDGSIRYIQGNPEHPVNRGVLCAKGSAGIMQHYSPARLSKPLLRVGERGSGEFREIEWDEALQLATGWLAPIRARNPDELAFFTGRDQSQALTGWWAQQFGTINYAAHGGFCSVNMAAGGLYTLGGSFWEFGEPDWEHSRYLMLWGVAEDHDSNPIKLGLGKLKGRGAKVVAINPVRTGYGAIADEWIGIRPGTDGLFAFALIHELLRNDRVDLEYLVRYTNAHWLVIRDPGAADDGLFARDAQGRALCWHVARDAATPPSVDTPARQTGVAPADGIDVSPAIVGDYTLPDGRRATPVFHLLAERYLDPQFAPDAVADTCGIPADTIRRIARELAAAAFDDPFSLPIEWTDSHGRTHAEMIGRPVSFHAMRGISAHSNGFHTCRAIHLLQLLLGAVDTPGSFRFQPPFPKPIPPANRPGRARRDNGALDAAPLGFIHSPDDLLVDEHGRPRRIDHAYSWAYPLAAHGMMHSVIRNAWAGDPYRIDTLLMFMANMSWNSSMNTTQTMRMLTDRDPDGAYRIPHIIYSDAYASEMVAYADLVLPDTTYLERHDCISLLDRPISDADAAADAIRQPVLATDADDPARDVRAFQSVLLDLGARLGLPGMVDTNGAPAYRDFADYMVRHERAPGVGLLAGWRGADGQSHGKGPPNPEQLQRYIEHGGFWHLPVPERGRYYKMANRDYLQWAQQMGFIGNAEPIVLQLYSETLQKFRLAAQGHGTVQPPPEHRARVETYFDPLPIWYETVEASAPAPASKAPLPPGEGLGRGSGEAGARLSADAFAEVTAHTPPEHSGDAHYPAPPGPSSGAAAPPSPAGRRAADGIDGDASAPAPAPASKAPLPPGEGLGRGSGEAGARLSADAFAEVTAHTPPEHSGDAHQPAPPGPSSAAAGSADGNRPNPSSAGRRAENGMDGGDSTGKRFPLHAITQRPMFMYHAWGSQNAWLRQIATRNYLYLHPDTARAHGVSDEDWVDITSHNGSITVQVKLAANVQPDTVWTWNAIGKRKGAWRLAKDAPEATQGFLLNHLISERTADNAYANADPVTGQAAWFDLRVSIRKSPRADLAEPQFAALELGRADNAPLRYGAGFRRKDHA